jgi:hypothetical protein
MTDLHKLEEYTIETIESFIKNGLEESIHIEFKSSGALSSEDKYKKEIAKDVSAFANSDGGIIVYGVLEEDHKAHSLSFIDGNKFSKEWLEQIINSSIQRSIPDLKIYPIRKDGDIKNTLYVVQIPSSTEAPHMVNKDKDNRFYRRYNFQSVMMEEYEVRSLYSRKVKSILALSSYGITKLPNSGEFVEFNCVASIQNIGQAIEDNYKLNVYLKNFPKTSGVYWNDDSRNRNHNFSFMESNRFKVSAFSLYPIYPDESLDVIGFNIKINEDFLPEAIETAIVEFVLLYPNGKDKIEVNFKDFFKTA